jgi:hypothetical protein
MFGLRWKTRSLYPRFSEVKVPKRVLVVRVGRLGDTILSTPVIEVLRQGLGADVVIDFACSPGASALLLEMDQRVNRIFPVAHRNITWRIHPAKRALEKHSRDCLAAQRSNDSRRRLAERPLPTTGPNDHSTKLFTITTHSLLFTRYVFVYFAYFVV